jgi:hypothetical protein
MLDFIDENLENVLGHGLDEERRATVTDLGQAPTWFVEEARRLKKGILRTAFLWHYVETSQRKHLSSFEERVLLAGADVAQWSHGRILVPAFSIRELVVRDVPLILAPLGPRPDESWLRFRPDRSRWNSGVFITGAPAVVRPDLRYDCTIPDEVFSYYLTEAEDLEPAGDITLATRRWLAACCARAAENRGALASTSDPKQMVAAAFPGIERASDDTMLAIEGLLAEQRLLGPTEREVPGFRGPDEWFQGRAPRAG